jgi:ribosomal protein S18 acetylase RimI-like enzyme
LLIMSEREMQPVEIRGARSDDVPALARLHLASWLATYRGICTDAFLDSLTAQTFEHYHRPLFDAAGKPDPASPFLVACDADSALIGFARGGATRRSGPLGDPLPDGFADRYAGELYAIYVDPLHQRRGVGRALFGSFAQGLLRLGHTSMCLWVFTQNLPARAFYERHGGRALADESFITLAGEQYPQVAYAWPDLQDLCKSLHETGSSNPGGELGK